MKESIMYQTISTEAGKLAETLQMHLPAEIARPIANAGITLGDLFASPSY